MDEPTANLDPYNVGLIKGIRAPAEQGAANNPGAGDTQRFPGAPAGGPGGLPAGGEDRRNCRYKGILRIAERCTHTGVCEWGDGVLREGEKRKPRSYRELRSPQRMNFVHFQVRPQSYIGGVETQNFASLQEAMIILWWDYFEAADQHTRLVEAVWLAKAPLQARLFGEDEIQVVDQHENHQVDAQQRRTPEQGLPRPASAPRTKSSGCAHIGRARWRPACGSGPRAPACPGRPGRIDGCTS